jgi:1,4-alpha-glucan branching enzyme
VEANVSDTKINRPAVNPAIPQATTKGGAPTNATEPRKETAAPAKKASTGTGAARAKDGFESTSKVSTKATDAFSPMGSASRQNVAGTRAAAPVMAAAAAAGQPTKRKVTITYDAGPHSDLTDVKLKGS